MSVTRASLPGRSITSQHSRPGGGVGEKYIGNHRTDGSLTRGESEGWERRAADASPIRGGTDGANRGRTQAAERPKRSAT